jgi:hypothetical protein
MLTALGTILSVFSCMPALGAVYEFAPPPRKSRSRYDFDINPLGVFYLVFILRVEVLYLQI